MKGNRFASIRAVLLTFLLAAGPPAVPVFGEPEWGENPFLAERGGSTPSEAPGSGSSKAEILLQGILWDPATPTAIINNRLLSKGDQVGRWEVEEIRRDQVVLSDGSETRVLRPE